MTDRSYSLLLRNLSNDYYHSYIGFDEYRAQRKIILDKLDQELNGADADRQSASSDDGNPLLMQTIGFFRNTDLGE